MKIQVFFSCLLDGYSLAQSKELSQKAPEAYIYGNFLLILSPD